MKTPSEHINEMWGERLRARRSQLGFTQVKFAEKVGRDQTTISRYERGDGPWTPETLLSFAVALDSSVRELFPWPSGLEDAERYRLMAASATRPKASA